jgi:hypothetical protein
MAEGHLERKLLQLNFTQIAKGHSALSTQPQPSQTSSEGYIFLLLYAKAVFLCIWKVLINSTRLDYRYQQCLKAEPQ